MNFICLAVGILCSAFCVSCFKDAEYKKIHLEMDMDRNHLQRCAALSGTTESERYWEARTKMSTVL